MKRVFLSYSYHDSEARQLSRFLQDKLPSLGVEPIIISDKIEAGDNWQMGITEQINRSSVFICFIERENPNVMFELGYALAKNKKIILVGDFKDLPADLRSMIYVAREAHPYDILMHVENYLSSEALNISPYESDLKHSENTIEMLFERPELLDSLEPRKFEEIVGEWFSMRGYNVEQTTTSRDYGYDLLISPFRGDRAVVEVKKYKSTSQVPLAVIRQLVGSMALERIPYGIIVSTAPFTKSVNFFVQDIEPIIFLWTLKDLLEMDNMPNKVIEQTPISDVIKINPIQKMGTNIWLRDKIGETGGFDEFFVKLQFYLWTKDPLTILNIDLDYEDVTHKQIGPQKIYIGDQPNKNDEQYEELDGSYRMIKKREINAKNAERIFISRRFICNHGEADGADYGGVTLVFELSSPNWEGIRTLTVKGKLADGGKLNIIDLSFKNMS